MAETDATISAKGYAHPETLVSTDWLAAHLDDANLRLIESDEDVLLYDTGHIPGAQKVDWHTDLNDAVHARLHLARAIRETAALEGDRRLDDRHLLRRQEQLVGGVRLLGVSALRLHQRQAARRRAGEVGAGRSSDGDGGPVVHRDELHGARARSDEKIRAFMADVRKHLDGKGKLVDVRSPDEYSGKKLHMPDYPQEGAMRGGHIPSAKSVPWARAANPDGSFKSADELRAIYEQEQGLVAEGRRDRLLPDRRTVEPYLVRAAATCSAMTRCAITTAVGPNGAMPSARRSRDEDSLK